MDKGSGTPSFPRLKRPSQVLNFDLVVCTYGIVDTSHDRFCSIGLFRPEFSEKENQEDNLSILESAVGKIKLHNYWALSA